MNRQRYKMIALNTMLVVASLLFCFVTIEIAYRVLDPFPYFSSFEINHTEHGNLSTYDETLGWKGVSSGEAKFVTDNNEVWLAHNRNGFRDIEHENSSDKRPTIVFLGDSFTWGYEVEFEEMFVNRLRAMLPDYEIFNLAHRGYGTDQEFLTFERWHGKQGVKLVVLMFSENDITDNNSMVRSNKPKPKYKIVENELVLTGVPVPKDEHWTQSARTPVESSFWKASAKKYLIRSHFLHDIHFRYKQFRQRNVNGNKEIRIGKNNKQDLTLTSRILDELKREVERRGAKLVVGLIPSKREIEKLDDSLPYQIKIAELCQQLDIECLDLAPDFNNTWFRTYYRQGSHWNARGHKIVAEALYDFVKRNVRP